MNCKRANEIMMDYLDSPLDTSIRKSAKLHKHMRKCTACREDFKAYDEITANLQFVDAVSAIPANIEACVMSKILSLELEASKKWVVKDNISFVICAVVSVLVGLYSVFLLNADTAQIISLQLADLASGIASLLNQYQYIFIFTAIGTALIQPRLRELVKARKNNND